MFRRCLSVSLSFVSNFAHQLPNRLARNLQGIDGNGPMNK